MKLREFLKDELSVKPGSVKIPIKSLIEGYRERYEKLINDPHKKFMHDVYRITPGDRIVVHVKVPSETLERFYYDVLIELDKGAVGVARIEDCDIHIFSNCPSFVYRYAYVFYHLDLDTEQSGNKKKKKNSGMLIDMFTSKIPKDKLLIDGTEDKYGADILNNEPVIRNSLGLPMFDKSLYFAIFYLQKISILSIFSTRKYRTEQQVLASVEAFDTLMAKRQQEEKREKQRNARIQKADEDKVKTVERKVRKANSISGITKPLKPKSLSKPRSPKGVKHIGGK